MPTNETILIGVLLGAIVILALMVIRLEVKLRRLLLGKDAKSLEDSILHLSSKLSAFESFRLESENYYRTIEKRLGRSIQHVHTVRFNALLGDGVGGNQSFATAFLDDNNNGVIFSSLYTRDRVSVFAKPLTNLKSTFELSEEEKRVLDEVVASAKKS